MNRAIFNEIQKHNFTELYKSCSHPRERGRFLAFSHLASGKTPAKAADIIRVTANTMYRWIRNFQTDGIEGLREKPGRGKKPLIADSEREAFRSAVIELQENRSGGSINGKDVLHLMKEKYGIEC